MGLITDLPEHVFQDQLDGEKAKTSSLLETLGCKPTRNPAYPCPDKEYRAEALAWWRQLFDNAAAFAEVTKRIRLQSEKDEILYGRTPNELERERDHIVEVLARFGWAAPS
jgi:hypothetical protein